MRRSLAVYIALLLGVLWSWWLPLLAIGQAQLINSNLIVVGHVNSCSATGAVNTYACTLDRTITAYQTRACYQFTANAANTDAATLNLNVLGAITIKKLQGGITTDLVANDIRTGQVVQVCYDGTNMQMVSSLGNTPATPTNVADGDKGAITVTGGLWTLDPLDLTTVSLTGTLAQFNTAVSDANLVPEARTITPSAPLGGGGDLSANRTVTCATCTTNAAALTANQLVIGGGSQASQALGSLGTTTTLLHGNAAGAPTFGPVSLTADVSGDLPYANLTPPSAASRLLARGDTTGDWQEVTLGGNCAMTGTVFNCTGGSSGITTDTAQRAAFYLTTTTVDGAPALTFATDGTTVDSIAPRITTRSATATLGSTDGPVVGCTGGASDVTLTLPPGGPTSTQRTFTIVKVDAGAGQCLVKGNGTETINGSTGTLAASTQWSRVDVALSQTSGTPNWSGVQGKTAINLATDVTGVLPVANGGTGSATPTRSIYIPAGNFDVNGACAVGAAAVLLTSGPKTVAITCTDAIADSIETNFTLPDGWNAGTLTVELILFNVGTNASTLVFEMSWIAKCVGTGEAPGTWAAVNHSTDVATSFSLTTTDNLLYQATSAALTPAGGCASGDHVFLKGEVDATATTMTPMADVKLLGVKVEYVRNAND